MADMINPNIILKSGEEYRDWWRTQIEFLLKSACTQVAYLLKNTLSKEQIKEKIEIEDKMVNKIIKEIDRLERFKKV